MLDKLQVQALLYLFLFIECGIYLRAFLESVAMYFVLPLMVEKMF